MNTGDTYDLRSIPRAPDPPLPPWRVPTPGSTGVELLPRRDPNMVVRARNLYEELSQAVHTPTLTLFPDREYRSNLTLGGPQSPLHNLLKNLVSSVEPAELQDVRMTATGRPVMISSEGGTMLSLGSSGFEPYPVAAAAHAPLDELIAASA